MSTILLKTLIVARLVKNFIEVMPDVSFSCSQVTGAYSEPHESTSQSEKCFGLDPCRY